MINQINVDLGLNILPQDEPKSEQFFYSRKYIFQYPIYTLCLFSVGWFVLPRPNK